MLNCTNLARALRAGAKAIDICAGGLSPAEYSEEALKSAQMRMYAKVLEQRLANDPKASSFRIPR